MTWIVLNLIFLFENFYFKTFVNIWGWKTYIRKFWKKILKSYVKELIFKVKNSLLELQKDFRELKDIELKEKEVKIKRELETIFWTDYDVYRWYG